MKHAKEEANVSSAKQTLITIVMRAVAGSGSDAVIFAGQPKSTANEKMNASDPTAHSNKTTRARKILLPSVKLLMR